MDNTTIDPAEDKKQKRKPQKSSQAFEKLEDISPEVFDKVLFDAQQSPEGWRCLRTPQEQSPAERELWHRIVERALSNGDYEHACLLPHEFEMDVLDSLFGCHLMLRKPGCIKTTHLISRITFDEELYFVTLDPRCVAIYG